MPFTLSSHRKSDSSGPLLSRKPFESISSHWCLYISKWQHSISSFCPLSSVSLSTSLFISRSPSSLRHTLHWAPLPHYLATPSVTYTNRHARTLTWANKHAELCSVFLHCCISLPPRSPPSLPVPQIASYLLIAAASPPHLSIMQMARLAVVIRLFEAAPLCWRQLSHAAEATKNYWNLISSLSSHGQHQAKISPSTCRISKSIRQIAMKLTEHIRAPQRMSPFDSSKPRAFHLRPGPQKSKIRLLEALNNHYIAVLLIQA